MFKQKIIDLGYTDEDLVPSEVKSLPIPNLGNVISFFNRLMKSTRPVCVHWDGDPDGTLGGYTTCSILMRLINNKRVKNYANKTKVHGITKDFIDICASNEFGFVIIVDSSSNDVEELMALLNTGVEVLILDHHPINRLLQHPNLVIVNSYNYAYGNNVSGCYIANEVMSLVYKTCMHKELNDYDELAVLTIVSDVCKRDDFNRNVLKKFIYGGYRRSKLLDCFRNSYTQNSIQFFISVTSSLNLIIRLFGARYLVKLLVENDFEAIQKILSSKPFFSDINNTVVEQIIQSSQIIQTDFYNIVILPDFVAKSNDLGFDILLRNYLGAVANKVAHKTDRFTMALCTNKVNYERIKQGSLFCFSARDPHNRDILSVVKNLDIESDGHAPAFGGYLYFNFAEKLKELNRVLLSKYGPAYRKEHLKVSVNDISVFLESDINLHSLSIWNSIRDSEEKIKAEFTLTGNILNGKGIRRINFNNYTFKTFDDRISILDRVLLVPEYNGSCELFLERQL